MAAGSGYYIGSQIDAAGWNPFTKAVNWWCGEQSYLAPAITITSMTGVGAAAYTDLYTFAKRDIKQIDWIAQKVGGLTYGQREILHEWITGLNLELGEIEELARLIKELFPNT